MESFSNGVSGALIQFDSSVVDFQGQGGEVQSQCSETVVDTVVIG